MKEKSDSLLNLVMSLSQKEKSQFVKYARQHVQKKIPQKVVLFRSVNKQVNGQIKDYRADAMKSIPESTFSSLKTHLYNQILTFLTVNSSKTLRGEVSKMVDEIQLLIDRGLLKQALIRIEKAKKMAIEGHLHFQFLEISLHHRRIIRGYKTKEVTELLSKEQVFCGNRVGWIAEEFETLEDYENYFLGQRMGKRPSDEAVKAGISQWKRKKIESFEGKVYYHLMMQKLFNWSGDFPSAFQESKQLVNMFEQNSTVVNEDLARYSRVVANYLNACFRLGDFESAEKKIKALKALRPKNFYAEAQLWSMLLNEEVILFFMQRKYEQIGQLTPRAKEIIEKYQTFISFERTMSICYNIAVTYFIGGNLGGALEWINICLQKRDISELKEKVSGKNFGILTQGKAMIFRILIFYEKGNYKLAKRFLPSTFYYFEERQLISTTSYIILKTLSAIVKDETTKRDNLIALKNILDKQSQFEEYSIWINENL